MVQRLVLLTARGAAASEIAVDVFCVPMTGALDALGFAQVVAVQESKRESFPRLGIPPELRHLSSNSHFDTGRYPRIVWSPAFRRFFCSFRLKAGLQTCQNENG